MAPLLSRLLGRPVQPTPRTLTASARQLSMVPRQRESIRKAERWQDSAFALWDKLGVVHGAYNLFANGLSRVHMFPAWQVSPDEDPISLVDVDDIEDPADRPPPQLVADALAAWEMLETSMAGLDSQGGMAGLISEHGLHLSLTGETVLWGHTVNGEETYEALSVRELQQRNGRWEVRRTPGYGPGEPVGPDDLTARVWRPHPAWSDLADSSLRPILDEGELLLLLQAGDLAIARSRIANSGILYVDASLDFGPADPTSDEDADIPFIEELVAEASAAILDPASASATVPLVITGTGPLADRITWIEVKRPLDAANMERATQAIRNIAMSSDLPPELILGKADANHWTAWSVDEQHAKVHIDPTLNLIRDGYRTGYLLPRMLTAGWDVAALRRLTVGRDLTNLVQQPDRSESAHKAYEQFALSTDSYLDAIGFSREDAPDEAEIQQRILVQAMIDSVRQQSPTVNGPPTPELEARMVHAITAAADTEDQPSAEPLVDLDRTLLDRLQGTADQIARRALEKAGARIVSSARKDTAARATIRDVPLSHVAATLGRQHVATLGLDESELIADAVAPMRDVFDRQVAAVQSAALDLADEMVGGLTDEERAEVEAQQAQDRDEAWVWLAAALTGYLLGLLFDPDPRKPDQGEFDPNATVPYGMLREAAARAGGAGRSLGPVADRIARGVEAGVDIATHGVAAGARILNLLAGHQIVQVGIRWVYGIIPRQSFPPHLALAGMTFTGYDDPGLTNYSGFPRTAHYYPGDHAGCRCITVPVLRRVG